MRLLLDLVPRRDVGIVGWGRDVDGGDRLVRVGSTRLIDNVPLEGDDE